MRLTISHALALSLALAAYSVSLYFMFRHGLYQDLDVKLRNDLESADDEGAAQQPTNQAMKHNPENWLTEIWTVSGQRIYTSGAADDFPLGGFDPGCSGRTGAINRTTADGLEVRVFCQESAFRRGDQTLRVARARGRIEGQLADFLLFALIAMPAVIVVSVLLGYFLAGRALNPVAQITAAARSISATRLAARLPVANPDDEIGDLARTFNGVFAELERVFQQMRRFSADASHELRTPLTAIRALGEVALRQRGGGRDPMETIASILEEAGRLQSLCDSLLLLSRADAGQIPITRTSADISKVVRETVEFLEILAEEKSQKVIVNCDRAITAVVDAKLLKHALSNLLDNAIKYSPVGASITVTLAAIAEITSISVRDTGPGIAEDQLGLIFQRFYRIDQSRARTDTAPGGAGLGLAIALWAIELHGGTIRVDSIVGKGSEFTIEIPSGRFS